MVMRLRSVLKWLVLGPLMALGSLMALVIVLGLSGVLDRPGSVIGHSPQDPAPTELPVAMAVATPSPEPARTRLTIPPSSHPATAAAQADARSYLASCALITAIHGGDEAACEEAQRQFERDYVAALRGSYASQVNVAGHLSGGPLHLTTVNFVQACAWWTVAINANSAAMRQGDRQQMARACGSLREQDQISAKARAAAIAKQIRRTPTVALAAPIAETTELEPPPECLDSTAMRLENIGKPAPPHPRESAACKAALARQRTR